MPADYLTGALQLTGLNAYGVEPLAYFEVSILKLMQWSNANNEIKNKLQMLRLGLGKYFLDKKNGLNRITNVPRSILFLRQDGKIGDYVASSFVFREIKNLIPTLKLV